MNLSMLLLGFFLGLGMGVMLGGWIVAFIGFSKNK